MTLYGFKICLVTSDPGGRPNYLKMIKEFARQYNKHVIIVVPDQSKFPNTYKTSGSDFTSQSSTNLPHGHTFILRRVLV
jgi:broad specificity polyphosphatase/5'/3'-nucleotidase SurE